MTLLSSNWYNIFYWLTVSDSVKRFFDVSSNIFTVLTIISFIILVIASIGKSSSISENNVQSPEDELKDSDVRSWESFRRYTSKVFWPLLILSLVTWVGYVATPSRKDCMLIVAGGAIGNFIGSDSSAKSLPADATEYLHLMLGKQISDLRNPKADSVITTVTTTTTVAAPAKQTFLDKAKNLTRDELVDAIKNDTTLFKK